MKTTLRFASIAAAIAHLLSQELEACENPEVDANMPEVFGRLALIAEHTQSALDCDLRLTPCTLEYDFEPGKSNADCGEGWHYYDFLGTVKDYLPYAGVWVGTELLHTKRVAIVPYPGRTDLESTMQAVAEHGAAHRAKKGGAA